MCSDDGGAGESVVAARDAYCLASKSHPASLVHASTRSSLTNEIPHSDASSEYQPSYDDEPRRPALSWAGAIASAALATQPPAVAVSHGRAWRGASLTICDCTGSASRGAEPGFGSPDPLRPA